MKTWNNFKCSRWDIGCVCSTYTGQIHVTRPNPLITTAPRSVRTTAKKGAMCDLGGFCPEEGTRFTMRSTQRYARKTGDIPRQCPCSRLYPLGQARRLNWGTQLDRLDVWSREQVRAVIDVSLTYSRPVVRYYIRLTSCTTHDMRYLHHTSHP